MRKRCESARMKKEDDKRRYVVVISEHIASQVCSEWKYEIDPPMFGSRDKALAAKRAQEHRAEAARIVSHDGHT